jgi:hypothetical protein
MVEDEASSYQQREQFWGVDMDVKRIATASISVIFPILLLGCASTTAPRHWLPTADEAQQEAYGAWITVEYNANPSEIIAEGEFIAKNSDSIFILTPEKFVAIPQNQIKKGKLVTYDSKYGVLGIWTLLGVLSTPSHGVGLIISAPVWIVLGSVMTSGQSYEPIEKYPSYSWNELRKFARFPQGMPKGLDPKTLKNK